MARALARSFADIIALARARLTQVEIDEDVSIDRAILVIQGDFGRYRVFIKETVSPTRRRYAFFVLLGDRVLLGLDNHADHQALRLKYGEDFAAHVHELIPHRHGPDKATLELTQEWTAQQFLNELDNLIVEFPEDASTASKG
jgi:hypothetical protein